MLSMQYILAVQLNYPIKSMLPPYGHSATAWWSMIYSDPVRTPRKRLQVLGEFLKS